MTELLLIASAVLALNLAISLLGMLRQPSASDSMLSAQLLGTNGVGLMLLLSVTQDQPSLVDAALVLALLAAVVVIAFTRRTQGETHD